MNDPVSLRVKIADGYEDCPALGLAGARKQTYLHTDERMSPAEEIPIYVYQPERVQAEWYGVGINHRVEHGHAMRELESEAWFVEIGSLEELVGLLRATGRRVSLARSPEPILEVAE